MTPSDRYAHTNPAFAALSLHWVAQGYQEIAAARAEVHAPRFLSPVWGIMALALLAPSRVRERLPRTAAAQLTNLFSENPTWRYTLPVAMQAWAEPFWSGVRFGVAAGVLDMQAGRLQATGGVTHPADEVSLTLRKCALVLGKIIAKQGADSAIALAVGIRVTR